MAVIGLGFIATRRHLPLWKRRRDVEVVAVADLNEYAANEGARRFRVASAFTDPKQLLDTVRPDIVDLCTPPQTHMELSRLAMESGSHVLLEKPMALSYRECELMLDGANTTGRKLCVIHNMLFYTPVMRALELIDGGAIGEFRGMRLMIANPVQEYLGTDGWVHRLPGGLVGETGPHAVYLSTAFVGPVHEVHAHKRKLSDFAWADADDYSILLVGERGSSSIRIVHNSDHWAGDLEVWGSSGRLNVDLQGMTLSTFSRNSLKRRVVARSVLRDAAGKIASVVGNAASVATGRFMSGHERVMDGFVKAVRDDSPVPVSPELAAASVQVLDEIVRQVTPRDGGTEGA